MNTSIYSMSHRWTLAPRRLQVVAVAMAIVVSAAARAQTGSTVDASFQFIDRSASATELLNRGKPQEALAIFQSLLSAQPGQDEDGYVATAIGDCLVALGRTDEARRAFQAAIASHPSLAPQLTDRIAELELAGPVTEVTLDRLRQAAAQATAANGFNTQWRLGRALQQRAKGLLEEAVVAFKAAGTPDSSGQLRLMVDLNSHAANIEDIKQDLAYLIEQAEKVRRFLSKPCDESQQSTVDPFTSESHSSEQVVRTAKGEHFEFQIRPRADKGPCGYTVNGQPLVLTPDQNRQLQHHLDRINDILMQAAKSQNVQGK